MDNTYKLNFISLLMLKLTLLRAQDSYPMRNRHKKHKKWKKTISTRTDLWTWAMIA